MGNFREIAVGPVSANGFLLPLTDVSSFKWVSVHFLGNVTATINFLSSNDGVNTPLGELFQGNSLSSSANSTGNPTNVIWHGPLYYRYFGLQVASYVSGSVSAIVEFYENVSWYVQNGIFLIPGNNSIGNTGSLNVPLGSVQQNASAQGTNAAAAATLTGAAGKFTYLTGFEISTSAAPLAATTLTITGLVGGTLTYEIPATLEPIESIQFTSALQSSAVNTNIVVTLNALGAAIIGSVNVHGYTL